MILSTKLRIPHLRNAIVSRPKLVSKLNEGMEAKLTLVSAQAGYGKTTALSEWVKQCGAPVTWVSLDKQDNDWIQFWSYITASIQERISDFGKPVWSLLEKGSLVSLEPAIKALLNELNQLTGELVIILDDYQFIELPDIHHSLTYLLEHLPPHIHLYIASRTDLPIPTARLLAKGELHRITMQDLRFQLEEGLVFFRDTTDLLLSKLQVTELLQQTEGWISGLQLAAISLKRSDNIAASIHQFNGRQHHISDYLLEEVFRHLPEQMRAFLLETSILGRMNRSLCQSVTGQLNCQELLEKLEQLNLFIIPLDDQRNWYRYHHLLSDFLQQLLFRTDPEKWMQAHSRAASWLEHHGFDEEGVEHFLQGKQYADVVRLIEKNLLSFVQSKMAVLIGWVSALPEDSYADKPMLQIFHIHVLLGVGQWEAAFRKTERAKIRFQNLREKLTDGEWNWAMGNIYYLCSVSSFLQRDLTRTSEYFELMERYMPEGSYFQTMGRNRSQAYDSFDDYLAIMNDLHAADAILLKWIKAWENKTEYPFVGFLYASYSKLLYEWNRLEEAEVHINRAIGRKDIQPFARILMQVFVSASSIQQAKGNSAKASELLEQLKVRMDSPDDALFMVKIEAEQASLSVRQGSLRYAFDWLQRCGLAHTDEVSLNRMAEHLALSRVLIACGRTEEALYLLERMYHLLYKEDCLRDRIKVLILQSVALQQLARTEAAHVQLKAALRFAEPEGYVRSFIDEGPVMAEMLSTYLQAHRGSRSSHTAEGSLAYVERLLQVFEVKLEVKLPLNEILTEKETRILQLLASGLSNKEIAHHLNITGETVKWHIKNVYGKLEIKNRVQALQCAKELKLLI